MKKIMLFFLALIVLSFIVIAFNETELNKTIPEINETLNDTIDLDQTIKNDTLINDTELNETNTTLINETIINITTPLNETINESPINNTIINDTNITPINNTINESPINNTNISNTELGINNTIINDTQINSTNQTNTTETNKTSEPSLNLMNIDKSKFIGILDIRYFTNKELLSIVSVEENELSPHTIITYEINGKMTKLIINNKNIKSLEKNEK